VCLILSDEPVIVTCISFHASQRVNFGFPLFFPLALFLGRKEVYDASPNLSTPCGGCRELLGL
jgi:hypothetical protein